MIAAGQAPLVFLALLAMSIWVGGFVTIVVVVRVAGGRLDSNSRIAFFRALGRAYGVVGTGALTVAIASGAVLLSDRDWDSTAMAAVLVSGALLVATGAGIVQARWMTRARQRAVRVDADDLAAAQVRRGARLAAALRAAIGALTLVLLVLVAVLATS